METIGKVSMFKNTDILIRVAVFCSKHTSLCLSMLCKFRSKIATGSTQSSPPKLRLMACTSSGQVGSRRDFLEKAATILIRLQKERDIWSNNSLSKRCSNCFGKAPSLQPINATVELGGLAILWTF